MTTEDRRLIEDYLPLDELNAIAAKEMKHPKHPMAMVHYWPARRPNTAARAAVYATLVPAPRTDAEREAAKLFVAKLAAYKPDARTVTEARERIRKAHGDRAPKVLDLFAGRGVIPLEATRLGCESHAIDYNPVAHLIELCTLVYPQTFGAGLADDFQHWGKVILDRMQREIGDLYPLVEIPETGEVAQQAQLFGSGNPELDRQTEPVAYIWARTVPCRRPGCAAPVPLVRQAWLRKKGGAVAAMPRIEKGNRLCWDIVSGNSVHEVSQQTEQTGAGQAVCVACNTPASTEHVKEMAAAKQIRESLAAVVVQGPRSKLYLSPDATLVPCEKEIERRLWVLESDLGYERPNESLQGKLRDQLPAYGVERYCNLFTPRQLLVLFTLEPLAKLLRRPDLGVELG